MSPAKSDVSTGIVEMLPGVRHYETVGFASSWKAYDALSSEDGWTETFEADRTQWKRGDVNGRRLVVHAPTHSRLDEATGQGRR